MCAVARAHHSLPPSPSGRDDSVREYSCSPHTPHAGRSRRNSAPRFFCEKDRCVCCHTTFLSHFSEQNERNKLLPFPFVLSGTTSPAPAPRSKTAANLVVFHLPALPKAVGTPKRVGTNEPTKPSARPWLHRCSLANPGYWHLTACCWGCSSHADTPRLGRSISLVFGPLYYAVPPERVGHPSPGQRYIDCVVKLRRMAARPSPVSTRYRYAHEWTTPFFLQRYVLSAATLAFFLHGGQAKSAAALLLRTYFHFHFMPARDWSGVRIGARAMLLLTLKMTKLPRRGKRYPSLKIRRLRFLLQQMYQPTTLTLTKLVVPASVKNDRKLVLLYTLFLFGSCHRRARKLLQCMLMRPLLFNKQETRS